MQKLTGICSSDKLLTLSTIFSMLYIVSTTIDYVCISYAFSICYTIQSSTRCPRERVAVNMQGTAIARLKIVPNYHQELVSHPMPEHIEA